MATIKQVEYAYNGKKRKNLRYDSAKKKWVGHRVDIRVDGKRRQPVFPTDAEARAYIRTVETQRPYKRDGLRVAVPASVTIVELFERRMAAISDHNERVRSRRVFDEFARQFDSIPLVTAIRPAHFQTFINRRLEAGVKPQTANREMNVLSTAFKNAAAMFPHELEGFASPEIVRPKYSKRRHRNKGEIEPWQKERIIHEIRSHRLKFERRPRTAARPVVALMFELGWMLGLRYSEVKYLLKTDFVEAERTLRAVRRKTGDVDILRYLPDRVCEIIAEASAASPTAYIFDLRVSKHTFDHILQEACEAAGIPYGRSKLGGITFHSTRHSFVTRMSQVTDPSTTQAYSGHSDAEMAIYYGQATEASKRLAMEKLYGDQTRQSLIEIYHQTAAGNLSQDDFTTKIKALFSL